MLDERLYIFTGPMVSMIVAGAFFLSWLYHRRYSYMLYFSGAFLSYSIAALMQMLNMPGDWGLNALISSAIYTVCILFMVKGALVRCKKDGYYNVFYILSVLVVCLTWYFYYVHQSIVMRIYVQNFGYGLMLLLAAARIGYRRRHRAIDRILFWSILLFGIQFFVRTAVTLPISENLLRLDQMRQEGVDPATILQLFNSSPFWLILHFSVLIFGFILALTFFAAVVVDIMDDLRREGGVDTLTGLTNRRGFDMQARLAIKKCSPRPASLVFCDLDHFKSINDTFGHAAGDMVLSEFAAVLDGELRRSDVAGRWGGEEFVVLLADTTWEQGVRFAERFRTRLANTSFDELDGRTVTASFGVVEVDPKESLGEAIHRADMMTYQAKRNGRNCIKSTEDEGGIGEPATA